MQPARFESFTAVQGHLPTAADEMAIDQATAKREHLHVGQQTCDRRQRSGEALHDLRDREVRGQRILRRHERRAGTARAGAVRGGRTGRIRQHQRRRGIESRAPITPEQLARIRAALPKTLIVRTGAQEAANQTSELEEKLGFLRTFLLIFAYVALVVGAFIIFNTFSITVAQRTREFGLLRTLGASRSQIMRSVVEEGLLLGVAGSVVGLLAGIGLAPALDGLFKAFGADLPDNGTVLETRTVIVSLGVGIVMTMLAGFFPALRATRVPPMAAMREGVAIPPRPLHSRVA